MSQAATMRRLKESGCRLTLMVAAATIFTTLVIWETLASPQYAGQSESSRWTIHIQAVDGALARRDLTAAIGAWHDAHAAALGSRRWDGLADVGDAYLRIGETAGSREAWQPRAQELYFSALFRAQRQGAFEGIVRAAEAFSALGDRQVVERALEIAERVARDRRDPGARKRVRELRERLTGGILHEKGADSPRLGVRVGHGAAS